MPQAGTTELRLTVPEASLFSVGNRQTLGFAVGDPDATFTMGLGGAVGHFLTDAVELGGELGVGVLAVDGASVFSFYLGPLARYVRPLSESTCGWAEGKLGFLYYRQSASAGRFSASASAPEFRIGASGGVDFVLTESVAAYGGLGVDFYMGELFLVSIGLTYGIRVYL